MVDVGRRPGHPRHLAAVMLLHNLRSSRLFGCKKNIVGRFRLTLVTSFQRKKDDKFEYGSETNKVCECRKTSASKKEVVCTIKKELAHTRRTMC